MPSAVRLGDNTTSHGCFPPTTLATASSNVLINGIGAVKVGDSIIPHCCPVSGCHDGTQSSGSPNVITNGNSQARVGDSISCGDSNADGSPNVIVN